MPRVGRSGPGTGNSGIQTLVFSKSSWTLSQAKKWASDHDFYSSPVDETDNSYRIRQFDPEHCRSDSFQTLTRNMPSGLRMVQCTGKSCGVGVMPDERKPTVTIKQMGDDGSGLARIATMNVIDKDGDVTRPGAFGEQHVKLLPAHNWGHVPLGKARMFEHADEALAEFQLNLESTAGREWHSALKFDLNNGQPVQEWSYGFSVLKASNGEFENQRVRFLESLKVHEVSPVVVGAGVNTSTLTIKRFKNSTATPKHSSEVSSDPWDGPLNEKRIKGDLSDIGPLVYAWSDPDGDQSSKSSWRFLHHFIKDDGSPGPASMRACWSYIQYLNGARGGTTIPDEDRKGIYDHLKKHLKDEGIIPPELRDVEECGIKLLDHIRLLSWDIEALAHRVKDKRESREESGKGLGEDTKTAVKDLETMMGNLHHSMGELKKAVIAGDAEDAEKLLAQFERIRAGIPA